LFHHLFSRSFEVTSTLRRFAPPKKAKQTSFDAQHTFQGQRAVSLKKHDAGIRSDFRRTTALVKGQFSICFWVCRNPQKPSHEKILPVFPATSDLDL